MDRRPWFYGGRIAATAALLVGGWVAFVLVGESWWQIAVAVVLAILFTQIGFLGHDAGHRQISRSARTSYVLGIRRQSRHRDELRLVGGEAQPPSCAPQY